MKTMQTTQTRQETGMKKMSLIAILAVASLMPTMAQQRHPAAPARPCPPRVETPCVHRAGMEGQRLSPEAVALKKAERCRHELGLSEAQFNDVFRLFKKEAEIAEKARQEGQVMDDGARKASHMRVEKKMKKILTDVQFAQWKEMKKPHRHHGPEGRGEF